MVITKTEIQSKLCEVDSCRLLPRHPGRHEQYPSRAWNFLNAKDRKKIAKAGFATPRGGEKGAYQNHVVRSNQVIIPYEKCREANLFEFKDGYVVRLRPDQFFQGPGQVKPEFLEPDSPVKLGTNAFILYRTHDSLKQLPPLPDWKVRDLLKDKKPVTKRGVGVVDTGHYVLRIARLGTKKPKNDGLPQGIFATEYADKETNFLCKALLAWLVTRTLENPYDKEDHSNLDAILNAEGLLDLSRLERAGVMRQGAASCPLCNQLIKYSDLHEMLDTAEEGRATAEQQVVGATRSTIVNLFHMKPLLYRPLEHKPNNVAWGHAVCNTRLGQQECLSLADLVSQGHELVIGATENPRKFGWISADGRIIRSQDGGVWIQITEATK